MAAKVLTYRGVPVTIVRVAKADDHGFDPHSKIEQVVIKFEHGGNEKVVPKQEVLGAPPTGEDGKAAKPETVAKTDAEKAAEKAAATGNK